MRMIRSDANRTHSISSMLADISNSLLDYLALFLREPHRGVLQLLTLRAFEPGSWRNARYSGQQTRVATIRSALVTVQPCAITPEGDQVSERKLIVIEVSHRSKAYEPSLTVGLAPRRLSGAPH